MKQNLLQQMEEFDRLRNSLLDEMEGLDADTLNAQPIPGKWSIIEIVEHLVNAEREVLNGMPDYSEIAPMATSFKNRLMYRAVMFVLTFGVNVRAPSRKMNPEGGETLAELRKRWDGNQKWFRGYVETLGKEDINTPVFRHPVAGALSVRQGVEMSIAHINRHRGQIERRLELLG